MVAQIPRVGRRSIFYLWAPVDKDIKRSKSKPKGNFALKSLLYTVRTNNVGFMNICKRNEKRERRRVQGRGRGQGSFVGIPLRKVIVDLYLHQLSARLLGWRRSCDPPAIVLELPAGDNHSHCYSRSCPHQFNSWKDRNYALNAPRELQSKNLHKTIGSVKEHSGERKETEYKLKWASHSFLPSGHAELWTLHRSQLYCSYTVKLNND